VICLLCQKQVDRLDAGTLSEIFDPGLYYAAGERIVWCRHCKKFLSQKVEVRIRDGGEPSSRIVQAKIKPRGDGV
jgi:hypothetical protein